jgi:signal transduction histidine kinase
VGQSEVNVSRDNGNIILEVVDHGPGLDVNQDNVPDGKLGLAGMRERVESLGGFFELESDKDEGTRVVAHLPLQATWRQG